jgi:hypothetical protein
MTVNLSYFAGAGWQFFDNNGSPLSGGKLYTYLAGTTTPAVTYTTVSGAINNPNPIVLDAAGRPPEEVWLTSGVSYKFVVKNSADVTSRTYDNLGSINDFSQFANTTDPALGDALVGFRQSNSSGNLSGAVGKTVHQKFQEIVSVKDFGAVGNGVTDDTAAIQLAFTYARTCINPAVYFPTGTYLTASTTTLYRLSSGMEVYGDGMDATIIKWNATYPGSTIALFAGAASGSINSATIRDLAIRGNHDTSGYVSEGCYPILVLACDDLKIHRVKVTYSQVMGIVSRGCFAVDVDSCVVQYCARDGINTANCNYVKITNNRIEFCDDDSIAGHTQTYDVADRGYVVTGNIIRFCQGMKFLGARTVTIVGNTIEFCMGQGISINTDALTSPQTEGAAAEQGVVIVGNTIKNCFDRAYVDARNSGAPYITIGGDSARQGSLAAIPGRNDVSTGTIVDPYPYYWTAKDSSATDPIADSCNVLISNNVLVRDMYPTAHISDYGCGEFYLRTGPSDPAVVEAAYLEQAILVADRIYNVKISNNVISGLASALNLAFSAQFFSSVFENNIVSDMSSNGITVNGGNTLNQSLIVRNNVFNLDPFLKSANRGANGTFISTGGGPTGLLIQGSSGYSIAGNTFKNCSRITDYSLDTIGVLGANKIHLMAPNYLECQPVTTGFSTSNKGIGNVPTGTSFILKCLDSDPTSATYETTLNNCPISANGVPTTGTYISGHVVLNNAPSVLGTAGSRYIVYGWTKLTTGSTNVLNTDWSELRQLTGT